MRRTKLWLLIVAALGCGDDEETYDRGPGCFDCVCCGVVYQEFRCHHVCPDCPSPCPEHEPEPKEPKPLGEPCFMASECKSGFCGDGVCCDQPCDGVCEHCYSTTGKCSLVCDPTGGAAGTPGAAGAGGQPPGAGGSGGS